jgi:hypothetical protein
MSATGVKSGVEVSRPDVLVCSPTGAQGTNLLAERAFY